MSDTKIEMLLSLYEAISFELKQEIENGLNYYVKEDCDDYMLIFTCRKIMYLEFQLYTIYKDLKELEGFDEKCFKNFDEADKIWIQEFMDIVE